MWITRLVCIFLDAHYGIGSSAQRANQLGWDLLVGGQPLQVKFHATSDGLREHFERYDYPVIANADLASQVLEEQAGSAFFVKGEQRSSLTRSP